MSSEKLLLIPGPSPVHPRILQALAQQTVSHVSAVLAQELSTSLANLKTIVFCGQGEPFIIAGAGTLSMEMALVNTIGRGERALVLSQGYFGERMAHICESFGLGCDVLAGAWGQAVPAEDLEQKLAGCHYDAVIATHVDTATGASAPVQDYARVLRGRGLLFILDGVCATGGIEERMDDWGIDVVLTAAQKCFGAPPGLAIAVFSERAMDKRKSLGSVPAYYADILRWLPIMKEPTRYFSTPCVNELRAFYEATRIILEEGLEARFRRHKRTAEAIRAGLVRLGFSFFTDPRYLAETLSVVRYPNGVEDKAFRARYFENGVVVAGGLAETAGRVFRMGHMGNLTSDQVVSAMEALEKTLRSLGYRFDPGSGVQSTRDVLAEA
jgi:aspartate aminotransferase-like enzyme